MSRDREREKKRDQEDEEEAYERRKLERKLRDKEAAYQEVGRLGALYWASIQVWRLQTNRFRSFPVKLNNMSVYHS